MSQQRKHILAFANRAPGAAQSPSQLQCFHGLPMAPMLAAMIEFENNGNWAALLVHRRIQPWKMQSVNTCKGPAFAFYPSVPSVSTRHKLPSKPRPQQENGKTLIQSFKCHYSLAMASWMDCFCLKETDVWWQLAEGQY